MSQPPAEAKNGPAETKAVPFDLRRAGLVILLCALPVLLYLPFLQEPFERDEGIYATIAQGLFDGRLPYRDYFEFKPPLVFGWYALGFSIFGENVVAPRIMAAFCLAVTTLLVFVAGRLLLTRRQAYFAAAIFAASTGLASLQFNANTEVFMLPFLVASLVAFVKGQREGRLAWVFVAGFAGGIAVLTKQVAVWNLVALGGCALWLGWQRRLPLFELLRPAVALGLGWAAATALVLAPFALTSTLDDFFKVSLVYGWNYTRNVPLQSRLGGLGRLALQLLATAPLIAAAGIGAAQLRRRLAEPSALILVTWAVGSLLGIASSGRFFPHYLVQLLPAFALLAAPVAESAWQGLLAGWRPGRHALAIWAVLFLSCLYFNLSIFLHTTPEARHIAKFPEAQARVEIASRALADYVRAETKPDETILNWGRETQIYFYADRKPATRYFYDRPFWQDPSTFDRAMVELRAHPPVLILDSLPPPGLDEPYAKYHPQAFLEFLAERYDYVGKVEFADVYRLKR
jgi:4-amino-4-deoxy-L-arabinose transferase-like glycosyltransferase